jgi:CHAT domain-containing protein/tetratricopeptide (TPR) repeat protein
MSEEVNDEGHLRKYLLGELNEAEQQAVEERLMTESELFALLPVVEDELIEDYLGELLSSDERGKFESFFVSTPERRRKLSFAMALRRYVTGEGVAEAPAVEAPTLETVTANPSPRISTGASSTTGATWWNRSFSTPYLSMAAAAVIVVGIVGIWWGFFYQSEVEKGMTALARAYRDERPLEARISGFGYAPLPDTRGNGLSKTDTVSLNLAERILLDEAQKQRTAAAYHALGRLYLAEKKFDHAFAQFEEALKRDPDNAQLHSDYGAALLEHGRALLGKYERGHDIEAFARSLEHLNRALAIDPKLQEALFDRALLHELMMIEDRAVEDWRSYAKNDSNSPWGHEARRHLDRLEEKQRRTGQSQHSVVEDFLNAYRDGDAEQAWALFSPNRESLITELLASYLNKSTQPVENLGRRALEALTYAGELDWKRTGDLYTRNLGRFYQSASPQRLTAAAEAIDLMSEAQKAYRSANVESAAVLRARGNDIFSRIGDRCGAQLSSYWLALHYWELGRTQQSSSMFGPLLRACDTDQHRWLRARSLHLRGGIAFKFEEYSNAIAYETEARELAEKLNDLSLASSARSAVIEHYRLLGNKGACLQQISESLKLLGQPALTLLTLWRQYDTLANAFNTFEYYDAAIDYGREALKFANISGDFVTISSCKAHLGVFYGKAGRQDQALYTIQQAYDAGAAHADQSLGPAVMAYATLQMGHLLRSRGELTKARELYDKTVELHERYGLDFPARLYQAYKGRLVCYMALNDTRAAQEQLVTLLDLMSKHRSNIFEEENRDSFFDVEQNVYDLGIDLEFSKLQDRQKAFEYAEVSRARSLLDSVSGNAKVIELGDQLDVLLQATNQPLPLSEIKARIPEDARLLEYVVLDDKLLVWVISRDDFKTVVVPVSQTALTKSIVRFLAELQDVSEAEPEDEETERLARELFNYLIAPIEPILAGYHTLIIVPDKVLNRLPWDALKSPVSNRFLLEDYLVTLAPSATLYALCTDLAVQKADKRDERIVSVGDPSFDDRAFPQLRRLTSAAGEAEAIAGFYSTSSSLLTGSAARESAVRDQMTKADVAHFALHCVVNDRSPMRSSLLLAKEPASGKEVSAFDGRLQAYEIYGLKLACMRLAVLSACQTGVERYYRGEGMIGIARACLVARVPLVVASLWPVHSDATAELMIRFHKCRKRKQLPTAEALWRAKQSLLQQTDGRYRKPYYWAAFELIGGHASF